MQRLNFILFSSLLVLLLFSHIQANIEYKNSSFYSMKDLEILAKNNNYLEFLEHAKDIKPHQRSQTWKNLLKKMAKGFIKQKISQKDYKSEIFLYIENLLNIPTLKNSDIFIAKRNSYGINFLKHCFNQTKPIKCESFAKSLLNKTPHLFAPDLGIKIGDILISKKITNNKIWPFFKEATKSDFSEFYCKRRGVKKILFSKLTKLLLTPTPENKIKTNILSIANNNCIKQLLPDLKNMIFSNNSTVNKELSFTILKEFNEIKMSKENLFLTLYILNGPNVGKTFNLAWNRLKYLGQNYSQRMNILSSLKQYDPLPGKIFSQFEPEKRDIILSHFIDNFPEYIHHYTTTCLDYLNGKHSDKFINGNPTTYCFDLFKSAKGKKWIDKKLMAKFEELSFLKL